YQSLVLRYPASRRSSGYLARLSRGTLLDPRSKLLLKSVLRVGLHGAAHLGDTLYLVVVLSEWRERISRDLDIVLSRLTAKLPHRNRNDFPGASGAEQRVRDSEGQSVGEKVVN